MYKYTLTKEAINKPILITRSNILENGVVIPIFAGVGGDYEVKDGVNCATCGDGNTAENSERIIPEATERQYQYICEAYKLTVGIPGILEIHSFEGEDIFSETKKEKKR